MAWWLIVLIILGALLFCIALYDTLQASDPILRNFPVVGHFRSLLSTSGPKLRQYIVAANDEERRQLSCPACLPSSSDHFWANPCRITQR